MKNFENSSNSGEKPYNIAKTPQEKSADITRRTFISGASALTVSSTIPSLTAEKISDEIIGSFMTEEDERKLAELELHYTDSEHADASHVTKKVLADNQGESESNETQKTWMQIFLEKTNTAAVDAANQLDSAVYNNSGKHVEYLQLKMARSAEQMRSSLMSKTVFIVESLFLFSVTYNIVNSYLKYKSKQAKDLRIEGAVNELSTRLDDQQLLLETLAETLKLQTESMAKALMEMADGDKTGIKEEIELIPKADALLQEVAESLSHMQLEDPAIA